MIHLNLSLIGNVRQSLHYHVSPLFEMAASLQVIAQAAHTPLQYPSAHDVWIESTLERFKEEDLLAEWDYLSPIFANHIPAFFASHASYQANGIEEQYDYLVDLPNEVFVQALQEVFSTQEEAQATPVELDFLEKPKAVKARFTLFLCTYMQFIFESKWEQLAPKLVHDIEMKSTQLLSQREMVQMLQGWFPTVTYDAETDCISFPEAQITAQITPHDHTSLSITSLVLSPSWFIENPTIEIIADQLCVTYGITV